MATTTDKARCCESPHTVASNKCPHLASFKDAGGLHAFSTILKYIFTSRAMACMKLPQPTCQSCQSGGGRLHACLQCVYFGCWSHGHLLNHFKEENHFMAVDVSHTEVYCHKCGDYVYDAELDAIVTNESNKVNEQNQKLLDANRASYHPWKGTKDDNTTISRNSQPLKISKNSLGLRGLINLGNTCFMNCILQSFVHNPLMRNYFLSDRHNNKECRLKYRNNMPPESDGNRNDVCLGCEMDVLFGQVFSGAKNPYTPHHILHSIWKFSNYFAGYEQQDAHEFLISSLNGLHTHLERTTLMKETENNHHNNNNNRHNHSNNHNHNNTRGGERCDCIVHTIFKGTMRSEVTCSECGFSSVTEDPFFDISLDIPKPPPPSSASASSSSSSSSTSTSSSHASSSSLPAPTVAPEGNPSATTPPMSPSQAPSSPNGTSPITSPSHSPSPSPVKKRNADDEPFLSPPVTSPVPTPIPTSKLFDNTLTACLERFTQPEQLGSDEKFLCSRCHTRQESIKQLSMKSLPVVVS